MTECFWVDPVGGEVDLGLRRYSEETTCPGHGYHNAIAPLGRHVGELPEFADDDPRWPAKCDHCDYRFTPEEFRQVWDDRIWQAADGRQWNDRTLPPGAMLDATWWHEWRRGPDGISLVVVLPPECWDMRQRHWLVDGPANNNPGPSGWTRTGDPRNPSSLTIRPSIATPTYHGFLTNGKLVPC